jgi:glycosyltransferase 2 family protein
MKKLIGLLVSLALLAVIWWQVDLDAIGAAMAAADPWWLGLGLATIVPLTLVTALRFTMLSRTRIGLWPATRLILGASTLNLVLPSKMGDLAKGLALTGKHGFDAKLAVALVVMERSLDMAALLFWGVLALVWVGADQPLLLLPAAGIGALLLLLLILLSPLRLASRLLELGGRVLPGKGGRWLTGFAGEWQEAVRWFWSDKRRVLSVSLVSLAIWGGHLAQFWLFAQGLGQVPFLDNMAFATLAILAGLLPFTMAGIGTRDAAILFLYAPYVTPGAAAVLGVLATLRYLIPAIAGLPFMGDYLQRGAREPRA